MTDAKTSAYFRQRDGHIEQGHQALNSDCTSVREPSFIDVARQLVERFVDEYCHAHLRRSIRYIAPADMANRRVKAIFVD